MVLFSFPQVVPAGSPPAPAPKCPPGPTNNTSSLSLEANNPRKGILSKGIFSLEKLENELARERNCLTHYYNVLPLPFE